MSCQECGYYYKGIKLQKCQCGKMKCVGCSYEYEGVIVCNNCVNRQIYKHNKECSGNLGIFPILIISAFLAGIIILPTILYLESLT